MRLTCENRNLKSNCLRNCVMRKVATYLADQRTHYLISASPKVGRLTLLVPQKVRVMIEAPSWSPWLGASPLTSLSTHCPLVDICSIDFLLVRRRSSPWWAASSFGSGLFTGLICGVIHTLRGCSSTGFGFPLCSTRVIHNIR